MREPPEAVSDAAGEIRIWFSGDEGTGATIGGVPTTTGAAIAEMERRNRLEEMRALAARLRVATADVQSLLERGEQEYLLRALDDVIRLAADLKKGAHLGR